MSENNNPNSENPNLSQRQKNRLESIEKGKTSQFLFSQTSKGLEFGSNLVETYKAFCQAKNQYLQSLEEIKKYESKSLTKIQI